MTGICAVAGEQALASNVFDKLLDSLVIRGTSRRKISMAKNDGGVVLMGVRESVEAGPGGLTTNGDFSLTVDGYHSEGDLIEEFSESPGRLAFNQLFGSPGAFAFIGIGAGELLAGRDPLGQKPLYYGFDRKLGLTAFASLRNPLDVSGIPEAKPVPPGAIVSVKDGKPSIEDTYRLRDAGEENFSEPDVIEKLGELLVKSVEKTVLDGSALAFSGGLDSGLVAEACKLAGYELTLVTVGIENQPELEHAKKMADELELPLVVRKLTKSDVIDLVPNVVKTVESTDPTVVGVALPFYATCQVAQAKGLRSIVAGQLSDEMFGGYGRFDKLAGKDSELRKEVWSSLLAASTNDFEPGDKIAVAHRMDLRCPFAYLPLVQYALKIPARLKVNIVQGKTVRKYILRRLASSWNMPSAISERPKKAIQYSTGVMNILEKEARSRGLGLGEFFKERFA